MTTFHHPWSQNADTREQFGLKSAAAVPTRDLGIVQTLISGNKSRRRRPTALDQRP